VALQREQIALRDDADERAAVINHHHMPKATLRHQKRGFYGAGLHGKRGNGFRSNRGNRIVGRAACQHHARHDVSLSDDADRTTGCIN
jgi:hypothetical protein